MTGERVADALRVQRRRFVREHHPDRGGDPEVFVAGMRRLSRPSGEPGRSPVVFYRRPRGLRRLSPVASRLTRLVRRTSVPPRVR